MAFIGNTNTTQAFTPAIDYFSGNGSTTAFTLSRPVASVAQVQVTIDNVAQNPSSAYTVSANTITFTSAPLSGTNNIYVYYTSPITQVIAPGQGTVNTTALGNITNIASGNSSLTLQTGSGNTTAVTIDTSQNVGIGTTSPTSGKLVISGTSVTTSQGIRLVGDTADARFICESATLGAGILGTFSNHSQLFYTNSTERMRIDSNGNLLVGTTSTLGGKLSVKTSGSTNAYFTNDAAGGYILEADAASNGGTYYFINFRKTGTGISNITSNGTTVAYNTGSDYRLKQNIQPITNALSKVLQLKPCKWDWKEFWGNGSSQGFVAHELAEIVPDCVTGTKDAVDADGNPVYQGIDTSFLVATLTAALQELKAINDQQAETINALTARIEALEAK